MRIEHVAIWTGNIEILKEYYLRYFEGTASYKYLNTVTRFTSYFISFNTGARLEIMSKHGVPDNLNDKDIMQSNPLLLITDKENSKFSNSTIIPLLYYFVQF